MSDAEHTYPVGVPLCKNGTAATRESAGAEAIGASSQDGAARDDARE